MDVEDVLNTTGTTEVRSLHLNEIARINDLPPGILC